MPLSPHEAPDLRPLTSESLITFVTDRPGHDLCYAIHATQIKNEINWTPKKSPNPEWFQFSESRKNL
jgi:dTDP-D-glucose 4,6-dehydratase